MKRVAHTCSIKDEAAEAVANKLKDTAFGYLNGVYDVEAVDKSEEKLERNIGTPQSCPFLDIDDLSAGSRVGGWSN